LIRSEVASPNTKKERGKASVTKQGKIQNGDQAAGRGAWGCSTKRRTGERKKVRKSKKKKTIKIPYKKPNGWIFRLRPRREHFLEREKLQEKEGVGG